MAYVPGVYKNNGVGCLSQNDNESVQLSEEGLILKTNLLTTPIIVQVGTNGLSTTNPNGLEVISPLNMTGNTIYNVDTITYPDNTQFTIQNPLSVGQGEFKIYSDSNDPSTSNANLNAETININCGSLNVGGNLNMSGLNIKAVNNINLNTINGLSPLTWGDFNGINAYNNLPFNLYELNDNAGALSSLSINGLTIQNPNTSIQYFIGVNGNDLVIDNNIDRLLMGTTTATYWGDYSVGSNSVISQNVNGNCIIDLNSRFGTLIAGDTDLAHNQTTIQIDDNNNEIALNAGSIVLNGGALISGTSGGNSGDHLVLTINGTTYKIALLNV